MAESRFHKIKQRRAERAPLTAHGGLNLVPLVDVLTSIVFFSLATYTGVALAAMTAFDLSLPPETITIRFERGVPDDPVATIEHLNSLGRKYGIGRGIHLGDTILGIKGRVGFDAPAAHLLIAAHRELEKLVLTGKQMFWKEQLGNLYGTLLHEGQFFDPLGRDLEAFLESSQRVVTGEVRVKIYPRSFAIEGVRSPHTLMRKEASYGEGSSLWTGSEAAAFAKVFGVPQMLAMNAREEEN